MEPTKKEDPVVKTGMFNNIKQLTKEAHIASLDASKTDD